MGDRLCLDRDLVVLWCKPGAPAGFLGLRQAIGEGSFPVSYVAFHRGLVEQAPGLNARMSSLGGLSHAGAGDATRARRKGGARRRPGSSSIGAACWAPAGAWRAWERSRRSSAGSSGAVPTGARPSAGRPREEKGERGSESAPGRRRLKGQLRSILSIPGHLRVAFACRLGYPAGEAHPYSRVRRPLGRFVHRNVYAEHRGGLEAPAPDGGRRDQQKRGSPARLAGDPLVPFVVGLLTCCRRAPLQGQTQSARTERYLLAACPFRNRSRRRRCCIPGTRCRPSSR